MKTASCTKALTRALSLILHNVYTFFTLHCNLMPRISHIRPPYLQKDWYFLKSCFYSGQNISGTFIIDSFTYSPSVNAFGFLAIICDIIKLDRPVTSSVLVATVNTFCCRWKSHFSSLIYLFLDSPQEHRLYLHVMFRHGGANCIFWSCNYLTAN